MKEIFETMIDNKILSKTLKDGISFSVTRMIKMITDNNKRNAGHSFGVVNSAIVNVKRSEEIQKTPHNMSVPCCTYF